MAGDVLMLEGVGGDAVAEIIAAGPLGPAAWAVGPPSLAAR